MRYDQPPSKLTWYHLPWLLCAEAGTLTYDRDRYRVHGVANNAVDAEWRGLLAHGPDGMVLTDLGRTMLADWKASPAGQKWLAEWDFDEESGDQADTGEPTAPPPLASGAAQLDLFGQAVAS